MKKSVTVIISSLIISLSVCISCKNFMQGSDVKDKLVEQIEFAKTDNPLKIESISPENSTGGISYNAPVEIRFNQAIEVKSFKYRILCNGEDFSTCFNEPEFSTLGNAVSFIPKLAELKNKFGETTFLDITIYIDGETKSAEGIRLGFESTIHKFRYNNSTDTDKPVVTEFRIGKTKESVLNNTDLLPAKDFSDWIYTGGENDDYASARTNKVWVYVKGYDYSSGIRKVYVTENLVTDTQGNQKGIFANINKECQNARFAPCKEQSYYETTFEYEFESQTDGLVQLSFSFSDGINKSLETKSNYVIKDTSVSKSSFEIYNKIPISEKMENLESYEKTIQKIQQDLSTVYLKLQDDIYYKTAASKLNSEKISLKYKTRTSDFKTVRLEKAPVNEAEYDFYVYMPQLIELTKNSDVIFSLQLTDDLGNVSEFEKIFPQQTRAYTVNYELNKYSVYAKDTAEDLNTWLYYFDNEQNTSSKIIYVEGSYKTVDIKNDLKYDFIQDENDINENSKIVVYVSQGKTLHSIPVISYKVNGTEAESEIIIPSYTYDIIPGPLNSGVSYINFYLTAEENGESKINKDSIYTIVYNSSDYLFFELEETPKLVKLSDGRLIKSLGQVSYTIPELSCNYFQLQIFSGNKTKKSGENGGRGINISADYDNIPPNLENAKYDSYVNSIPGIFYIGGVTDIPDEVILSDYYISKCSGLASNDNGKTTKINYWYGNLQHAENKMTAELLSQIYRKQTVILELSDKNTAEVAEVETYIPGPGTYYCYIQAFDNNGNFNEYPSRILDMEYYPLVTPEYSYTYSGDKITIKISGKLEDTVLINNNNESSFDNISYYLKYSSYKKRYPENGEKNNNFSLVINGSTVDNSNKRYTLNGTLSDDMANDFVYVYVNGRYMVDNKGSSEYLFAAPFIFYADNAGKYTLTKKKLIDISKDAVGISSDAPVLVHTMYNATTFEDDAESWLRYSAELNTQVFTSADYYEFETEEIPNDCYYCAIAHFADGSTKISKVYKK